MVSTVAPASSGDHDLFERNRTFYESLWSGAKLVEPQRFNTWPTVQALAAASPERLEVGPGLRPRLPIANTTFADISTFALAAFEARGGRAVASQITALPFADNAFDLVCALDIVEHVEDDDAALRELARVARPGAAILLSTPLHPSRWTPFDDFVGHKRRYEPRELLHKLQQHGLSVQRSAAFGMQPASSRLLDFGMWWLLHHRDVAMRYYNGLFMPLALRLQKPLIFGAGLIETRDVDEVLLVCGKA